MLKKNFLFIVLFCFVQGIGAQTNDDHGNSATKIIPPSPNASALEKFGDIPIDFSTGVPSISYPMWSWKRGKLSYSAGLSYHAGGNKAEDMASNVGLGWAATLNGRISRTVVGRPDDLTYYGFIESAVLLNASTPFYNGDYFFLTNGIPDQTNPNIMITSTNSTSSSQLVDIGKGHLDGAQDIFSISYGGISCKFVIDKYKNIMPLEKTNLKITMTSDSYHKIVAFTVVDDKGLIYTFDKLETESGEPISSSTALPPSPLETYNSGWLISKILDPTTKDSILFNYGIVASPKIMESGFSQTQSQDFGIFVSSINAVNEVWAPPVNTFSSMSISTWEPILQSVALPDGSSIQFGYNFARDDYRKDTALTTVTVKNLDNLVIKKFGLNYSYYTCPNETMSSTGTVNDYNKRLRLDRIDEYASDNLSSKATLFTYDPIALNRRDTRNLDYWGYNVNPSRNNVEYVPKVPLLAQEYNLGTNPNRQLYLAGADRRPDSVYVKAGILEKITYPTGGFTSFEYEANKAFSATNYYEDKLTSNTPDWTQPNFGQNYAIGFPSRVNTAVQFNFLTQEFGTRPPPDPNGPYTCLDNSQDLQIARFEITSTDGLFSAFEEKTYGEFLGIGSTKVFDLPLGKTYNIKFVYNSLANCSFSYPFKAFVIATYYIAPVDKLAGGLRIKKITNNDGSKNIGVKEYNYNNPDGNSSASLNIIPNFGYYRSTVDAFCAACGGIAPSGAQHIYQIVRSSSPMYSLDFHNNSPLVYTKVTQKEFDNSSIERTYDPLYNDNVSSGNYPYYPVEQYPMLSGMLIKETTKDKTGGVKREKTITYTKYISNLSGNENDNIKVGKIASANSYNKEGYVTVVYRHKLAYAEETGSTTKEYENGITFTQVESKTYDPVKEYLRSVITTNSKNEQRTALLSYAFDKVGTQYSFMVSRNMLNYPTGTTLSKTNVVGGELTNNQTNYQLYQSNILPMPSNMQSSILGSALETETTFDAYDDKGNLIQFTGKDGIITSFIWGYRKQYPVAKIIGKTYADAIAQSLISLTVVEIPSSDAALRIELNKLRSLTGCQVATYTYKSLVGVTSETDVNGFSTYYSYDNYNRLSLVRDRDNNILKKICYNYQGQPMDCGYGSAAVWTPISSTCEINAGVFTGNSIVTEKDLNPASATTGQTRTVVSTIPTTICNCSGIDKKIINGVCEAGVEVCTGDFFSGGWQHYYHYLWSDNSISATFTKPLRCPF